ncbi:hypothetical protein EJV47_14190 [Hymenobacter gummosus]|uniref:RHS repeat protein n=1 Tax=Hymenobacter gummosus TaxID=1776032 RepID=A0A3S0QHQ7_9BACT|nr:hypothetical protein [Hymenobacter gummosus]RTQ49286.1 hypothetical protein EJV47_14190 [Hymenobacter gummosus]
MIRIVLPLGLLSSLLLALPAAGQQYPSAAAAAGPQPEPATAAPPALDDPTAYLQPEPNAATRQLYARQRVRTVLKVRLNDEGQVRDTVEYQEVDTQGRRTLLHRYSSDWQERRQWSYDAAGNCTSLVIHPVPGRSFTTIYTYNPELGRGRCEVLEPNGHRTTVCELQRRQLGDTLLTEARFWDLTVGRYHFAAGYRRNWRFALAPDTVLLLAGSYSPKGRLQSTQMQYELRADGRLTQQGEVDLHQILRTHRRRAAQPDEQIPFRQFPALLRRHPEGFKPNTQFYYDARQRLVTQEHTATVVVQQGTNFPTYGSARVPRSISNTYNPYPVRRLNTVQTVVTNTYNNLGQLIAQQLRVTGASSLGPKAYQVFSYQPDGLPAGETSRSTGQPVFYRYHYQYYE